MKLLSAEKVKGKIDIKEEQQKIRIEKMGKEEKEASKRLNYILLIERNEKKRIQENKSQAVLKVKKSILEKEVDMLEERKKIALAPIHALQKETEIALNEAKNQIALIMDRRRILGEKESVLMNRLETVLDREEEIIEKERGLTNRELGIKAAEDEIQRSTDRLSSQWVEFHKNVHIKNTEFEARESNIIQKERLNDAIEKANSDKLLELKAEQKRIQEEDRAVQDKYAALAAAKRHLGIK